MPTADSRSSILLMQSKEIVIMKNSHRDLLRKTGKGLKVGMLYLLVLALIMVWDSGWLIRECVIRKAWHP